jgi:5'(3')-deoxyribonucleotidase
MITALSKDEHAQKLRIQNCKKLFGETAFTQFIFCDTGADKDEVLEPYRDTGYIWIEDKLENAQLGNRLGLESIMVEHAHNMNNDEFPTFATWKDIYEYVTE